ncbi:MAG: hypothetical protein GQ549_02940 [Gammaproteobacteria bacterium]|nr:hypothetical protein [Gammaproteobacteria bacterium]
MIKLSRYDLIRLGLLCLLVTSSAAAAKDIRYALVIGNASYAIDALANPINDAQDISDKLKQLDFNVETHLDIDKTSIAKTIENFYRNITDRDAVSVFYYAGHAIQLNNNNYLIPVDANISSLNSLDSEAYGFNQLLLNMHKARSRTNIVILDACRNNPFIAQGAGENNRSLSTESTATNNGLAPIEAPPGTLIAYATEPGKVAKDCAGRNGTYTRYLLKYLSLPVGIEKMFKTVRAAVMQETGNSQVPWEHSSLYRDFMFKRDEASDVPNIPSF